MMSGKFVDKSTATRLDRRFCPLTTATPVTAVVAAVIAGGSVSAATESSEADSLSVAFEDGTSELMCNEGLLDHTSYTYGEEQRGHSSAARAANAHRTETRRLAREFIDAHIEERRETRGQPEELAPLGQELRQLMAPSLNYSTGEQKASQQPGVIFYDRMAANGVLESRIVIHEEEGAYFIEDTYRCIETITTDKDALAVLDGAVDGAVNGNPETDEER